MDRSKMSSSGRGGKSKGPQHPQDIFALGGKSTVVVSRDSEKRNIHKPSTSGVGERKREPSGFGNQPPSKRSRIGSPAESVSGTSLEVDPVDLVPNVLQALDTHNSDKLLGLLTGSIRLLKSQRSKPDPILCMSMLYLTKIRPNMFAHETVTQTLCTLLKREQGAAFKSKGNPLVFVLACNMLYAGHKDSNNWPDTFIKVYIEDALNERWWVDCSWCKCLVENIVTAFGTKQPASHLIPSENTLGTMSPSGSGSPLMGSNEEDTDNTDLEYSVFPRYSSSYETVEALVLEAIKEQIQRRVAPDAIGKGFLKLLSATCGFPEIRMIAASRLEAWLHSGKLWRAAQELLAHVCANAHAAGPSAARDHEVLAQLVRMRLKTKPLQTAYQSCLREMVSESPALLRSVVTHTIYNELSNVRSPNNMAVLAALIQAQPQLVPAAMADTYQEIVFRPDDYLRSLRALTRECVRATRSDAQALLPLARALAHPPPIDPPQEIRERAFQSIADLFCVCCLVTAAHSKHAADYRTQLCALQQQALGWMLDTAVAVYRPSRLDCLHVLNKIMFVEPAETYSKVDNWPPESERALTYRLCCEAPLPQNTLLRLIFIGLSEDIPVTATEVFELIEQLVRRACALPPEDQPLQVEKLEIAEYIFKLCQFHPPDNIILPAGYTAPPLAITSLYWRGWMLLTMLAAHNPLVFAERAANTYPTLRALIECCITSKPSIEWNGTGEPERLEAERATVLQLETHLATASNAKLPITEHSSRLLTQLTTMDPQGPARRPPATVLDALQSLSSQLRLSRLLCRQPALLLQLVERHGTRRAMPWLHQLLRHDRLELSVLPVQCLCEFLSAGGTSGGTGEAGKAGELCAHLRRTLHSEEGARAVLRYYLQRLAHAHAPTRASANRGLKLVLSQTDDTIEMDYNTDVNPDTWLPLLPPLRHWEVLRGEAVRRVRAACLVECSPPHLAAYLGFLATQTPHAHHHDLTDIVLDLSQVLMERTTVMGYVLPPVDSNETPRDERLLAQHKALNALTNIFYTHLRQVLTNEIPEPQEPMEEGLEGSSGWNAGEKVLLQWTNGRSANLHVVVAHAHLKLLCFGPSYLDSNQEMYSWLLSTWIIDAPEAFSDTSDSSILLPDWLRLSLVRSARPPLLEAGLRGLPAHKLALFIQTFGMPVTSMSALLGALDACPAGAVVRLGVERAYMAQLLRVQRARGALGGHAFAAALRLSRPQYPPDDTLFTEETLPDEEEDPWSCTRQTVKLDIGMVGALLSTAFNGADNFRGDMDSAFAQLHGFIVDEAHNDPLASYTRATVAFLKSCNLVGLLRQPAHAAPLLRALTHASPAGFTQVASTLLSQCKLARGPVAEALRVASGAVVTTDTPLPIVPSHATKDQLVSALESATPSTLEAIGNKIIETQDTQVVVDTITHLLEKNQEGCYEILVKCEAEEEKFSKTAVHVLSVRGLGCGLLLDWLSELQRETLGRQMRLMFVRGGGTWRPLLVTLLAHRASWRTLHAALDKLTSQGGWSARSVLDFAETLIGSPRVWQGRDRATPKHHSPDDSLRLTHKQLDVLIRYVGEEAAEAEASEGMEAARRRIEARLPLILRCCATPHSLLAAALAASNSHPLLLLLLYMKVPKVLQLLRECSELPPTSITEIAGDETRAAARLSTSATDRVSHALLTALAAPHHHSKEHSQRMWRTEAGARAVFSRCTGAGARALPLAGALLRGVRARHHQHLQHLLAALEMLPDRDLFADPVLEEIHGILECYLNVVKQGGSSISSGSSGSSVVHRVAALLRRYRVAKPLKAAALLQKHRDTVAAHPALAGAAGGEAPPASATPPPHALLALQRRIAPPDELHWFLQEIEAWGVRRGGAWGGPASADALLRAAAPLAASPHAPLRTSALSLLTKLLPAAPDTHPGLLAILECLDSSQPEIAQSALDKLPKLLVGIQEHASRVLTKVFDLGLRSRLPVEQCISKCVSTINFNRGC